VNILNHKNRIINHDNISYGLTRFHGRERVAVSEDDYQQLCIRSGGGNNFIRFHQRLFDVGRAARPFLCQYRRL
jgi:hypothetical protein